VNNVILQQLGNAVLATEDAALRALLSEFGYEVTPDAPTENAGAAAP
jgi:hypothetical protein